MKWFEISSGTKDPNFLLNNYPEVNEFLKQHCFVFGDNSKYNETDSTWFTQNKLYLLKDKREIFAVMRETIPFSIKTRFIQHELATDNMKTVNEQNKFIDLFQKEILKNLPNMCEQSIFLTFHPIKTKIDDESTTESRLLFDKQIRSILPIIRNKKIQGKSNVLSKIKFDQEIETEVLESPVKQDDYKIIKKFSDNATNEANGHIKNELLRKYFLISETEKDTYEDYKKDWNPISKSIFSIIRKSGLIIGYTHIIRHAFIQNMAFQAMTYIAPEYRGQGLSKILKKNTYDFLVENENWNDIDMIMTNNHSNNAPMLKVNNQLGFIKVTYFLGWLFDLKN